MNSHKAFKLSPELKAELEDKGAVTIVIEALAFIGLLAVGYLSIIMIGAIL